MNLKNFIINKIHIDEKKFYVIMLALILLLSFLLRLYKLGDKPVWFDESTSIAHAEKTIPAYYLSPRVNYKPVYFFLLKMWLFAFGTDPFALRFLSLIFGVFSVFLVYKLASLIFSKREGLISAFLLAISVFHIFQCQQIRQFSLIVFLSIISVYFMFKFSKSGKMAFLLFNTFANALIINTHPPGFLIIFCEFIFLILVLPKVFFRRWIFSQLVLFFVFLVWVSLPDKTLFARLIWWVQKPNLSSIRETLDTLSWGGQRYGLDDFRIPLSWFGPARLLSIAYLFFILYGLKMKDENNKSAVYFLLLWLLFPIVTFYLFSVISISSIYMIKHFIITLPPFYILSARGISNLRGNLKKIVLGVIFLLNIIPLYIMYNNRFSVDWRESTAYVKKFSKPGDVIVVSTLHEIVPFMYYFDDDKFSLRDMEIYGRMSGRDKYESIFLTKKGILVAGILGTHFFGYEDVTTEDDFRKKIISGRKFKDKNMWVMLSRWVIPEESNAIFAYLRKNFREMSCNSFRGVDVCYYVPLEK
jgi:hypothetical protein